MTHGPTHIPSRGVCIYCGKSNAKLTDEHVLPVFLGGFHVLKGASCDACARITSRFELDVARRLWGDARASYDAPSRRKKLRQKAIVLDDIVTPGGKITIPFREYPAPMVFYLMRTAGALLGLPEDIDLSGAWQFRAAVDKERIKAFEDKYPGRLTAKFRHVPESFGRLIAKIGYGQILCSLAPSDFQSVCLPYILGQKNNVSYVVGGRWSLPEPTPGIGYSLSSHFIGTAHRGLLIAEIRMVANWQTPVYHVVVGTVSGADQVAGALAKLEATCTITITNEQAYKPPLDDCFHWLPRIWPPPIVAHQGEPNWRARKAGARALESS